ncbi:MAG: hypothetical protein AABY22_31810, partial [Nanoarchaeota archaeon]
KNKENWDKLESLKQTKERIMEYDIQKYLVRLKKLQDIRNVKLFHNKKKQLIEYEQNLTVYENINKLESNSEILKKEYEFTNEELSHIVQKYDTNRIFFDQRTKKLKELETNKSKSDFIDVYLKCINEKTGIPNYIIKNVCQSLTFGCNQILDKITDFSIDISFSTKLEIYTLYNNMKIPAEMSSGFQKFILDMILRVCLLGISDISNPGILFIDEGFGSLDKENFVNVCEILTELKENFNSIFIITHIEELKMYADKTIGIISNEGKSLLQYGNEMKNALVPVTCSEKLSVDIDDTSNLLIIEGDQVFCKCCRKYFKNNKNSIKKHIDAKTYALKHEKYLRTCGNL